MIPDSDTSLISNNDHLWADGERRTVPREARMSIDPYIVLGSAVVGFLVGMTGAGGGALMTPMLILFFNVKPSTAISSDLVAAVLMRPVGAAVHMTKKTVNYGLVGYMVLGSVPAALLGAWSLHLLGNSKGAENQRPDHPRRRPARRGGRHGAARGPRQALGPAPRGPHRRRRRAARSPRSPSAWSAASSSA